MHHVQNPERPIALCSHLALDVGADEYRVWFTGDERDSYWVCAECAARYPTTPAELIKSAEDRIAALIEDGCWEGILGTPEIKKRSEQLHFHHDEIGAADGLAAIADFQEWIDIQPNLNSNGEWFVLLRSGAIAAMTPRLGEFNVLYRFDALGFELDDETGLCISPTANFAAIYQTSGRQACVLDMRQGKISIRIDRGKYRPENSHFPIAFFEIEQRKLMVCATDWNRLDIFDPATGKVLTERGPTSYQTGEQRPEHYLDYFHAQLLVSPNGQWIVDNGWVWDPSGIVRSWCLREWLERNPWESEDGPSLKSLAWRRYYWDGPMCWTDDTTIAIWGWGEDDEWLLPAIRLIDVPGGQQIRWFPGPDVRRPRAWPPKKLAPSLFFDQYLFSIHDVRGTAVWDITSGEQLLVDETLIPIHYHPVSKEFISLNSDKIRLSRLVA